MKITGEIDLPSREEVLRRIRDLRTGSLTNEQVAEWAESFVSADWQRGLEPRITDWPVWEMLNTLSGVDLRDAPTSYLHGPENFAAWENELLSAP